VFLLTPLGRSTAGWLTVGRDVTVTLSQNYYENVFIYKKMRHERTIVLVSVWKQTATRLESCHS